MSKKAAGKQAAQPDVQKATILVNLYDGTRELLPAQAKVLPLIIDGEQHHVFERFVKARQFSRLTEQEPFSSRTPGCGVGPASERGSLCGYHISSWQ